MGVARGGGYIFGIVWSMEKALVPRVLAAAGLSSAYIIRPPKPETLRAGSPKPPKDPLLLKFMSQSAERDGRFAAAAELLQIHPQARPKGSHVPLFKGSYKSSYKGSYKSSYKGYYKGSYKSSYKGYHKSSFKDY